MPVRPASRPRSTVALLTNIASEKEEIAVQLEEIDVVRMVRTHGTTDLHHSDSTPPSLRIPSHPLEQCLQI